MKICEICNSLILNDVCSNAHCGKKVIMWATTPASLYKKDIQTNHDLIRAHRHTSEQMMKMGEFLPHRTIGQQ